MEADEKAAEVSRVGAGLGTAAKFDVCCLPGGLAAASAPGWDTAGAAAETPAGADNGTVGGVGPLPLPLLLVLVLMA